MKNILFLLHNISQHIWKFVILFNDKFVLVSSVLVCIKDYLFRPAAVISSANKLAVFNKPTCLLYIVENGTLSDEHCEVSKSLWIVSEVIIHKLNWTCFGLLEKNVFKAFLIKFLI